METLDLELGWDGAIGKRVSPGCGQAAVKVG